MGNPLDFILTPGQAHDLEGADALLPDMAAEALLADKAFDADERVIEPLLARGKSFVIPPKSNRKVQRDFDKDAYKARHLIENFFCKLKQYRAIATRYDKTARNFLAAIHLAAAIIGKRQERAEALFPGARCSVDASFFLVASENPRVLMRRSLCS